MMLGFIHSNSEESSVPAILKIFMSMLLDGPKMSRYYNQEELPLFKNDKAALCISQEIIYITVEQQRCNVTSTPRHVTVRVTSYPLYVGIKSYLTTKKTMVDRLQVSGTPVSYDRVRQLTLINSSPEGERHRSSPAGQNWCIHSHMIGQC